MKTWFERAIFFSWYCDIRDCAYCYMSTQPKKKKAVRSQASILAELLICKKLKWKVGFISGGIGAFSKTEFKNLLKNMYKVSKEKFWLNIGPLDKQTLKLYLPYTKGIVGSIETINPRLHKLVCPSKPTKPYEKMFRISKRLKLKNAMTIILGLGETIDDFEKLKRFIKKYNIVKIHFYGLNPQKGTIFEKADPPSKEYQAEWIKKTRQIFPKIDIQCGIWKDRVDYIPTLLEAGSNSISKFPAIRLFNSDYAKKIEQKVKKTNRTFVGSLTKLPKINWNKEIDKLNIEKGLKEQVRKKLFKYLEVMRKSKK